METDLFGHDIPPPPADLKGVDALFAYARDFRRCDRFRAMLRFAAAARDLAPYNAMMVHIQKPDARHVLPAATWLRYNRVPRPDARPVVVLWPFQPVQYWFDIGDTAVIPDQADLFPPELARLPDEEPQGEPTAELRDALAANLPLWGIALRAVAATPEFGNALTTGVVGLSRLRIPVDAAGAIVKWPPCYALSVRRGATPAEEVSVIVHELARLFCGHLPSTYPEHAWEWRGDLPQETRDFEVETVAWLVFHRRSLRDDRSSAFVSDYLASHSEIPTVAIDALMGAVGAIEQMLRRRSVVSGLLYKNSAEFRDAVAGVREPRPGHAEPKPPVQLMMPWG